MPVKTILTQKQQDMLVNMASNGLGIKHIAEALGISVSAINHNDDLHDLFRKHYLEFVNNVAGTLRKKALEQEDLGSLIFLLKTRAQWREHSYYKLNDFNGSYEQKMKAIDDAFMNEQMSVEDYSSICKSLIERSKAEMKLEDIEARIALLEQSNNLSKQGDS